MRKISLDYWWVTPLLCLLLSAGNVEAQHAQKSPNIIFIMADDMGYGDIKAFNSQSKISTPHLDKLAASGMMFTDAHAPASSCVPSRYGLLTGQYPFRAKHMNWRTEPLIEKGRMTMASVLQKNGYQTGMVGKWHLGFDYSDYNNLTGGPVDQGFDYYYGISRSLDQEDYYFIENNQAVQAPTEKVAASPGYGKNGWQGAFWREGNAAPDFKHDQVLSTFTQKSISFIKDAADNLSPFFLYLALASPHTPWLASEKFKGTSDVGDWGDWVAENDHSIGAVVQAVYDAGLKENTLIIFTSDNGPVWWPIDIEEYGHRSTSYYRGMKFDAWEGGHRMPFIASWPGVIEQGSKSGQIISHTDMLATFAALVKEPLPATAAEDSYNILPALYSQDDNKPIHEALVGRPDNTDLYIRQGEWKLIGKDQLYNLIRDPSETRNVYEENKDKASQLYALLEKYKTDGRSRPLQHHPSPKTSVNSANPSIGSTKIDLMSYNLKFASPTFEPSWDVRREMQVDMIRKYSPDIIGTQEGLKEQIDYLMDSLPEYVVVGEGRKGGDDDEHMAIFFKRDKFRLREMGSFQLSETPDIIGSGPKVNPRMVTWARLAVINRPGDGSETYPMDYRGHWENTQEFYVFNTHYFNRRDQAQARLNASKLILERIKELDGFGDWTEKRPVFLMGDFNCKPGSPPYKVFVYEPNKLDSNGFRDSLEGGSGIDWILYKGNVDILHYEQVDYNIDGAYPSDHKPIFVRSRIDK